MPVHTVYFHDFIEPELIEENLLNLCLKTEKSDFRAQHPINQAVIFHNEFMRIFPFSNGCGKIARIFMNGFLTQGGYPYSVIHCSERQRYYETLRDGNEQLRDLLLDSYDAALDAQFKFLKDIDKRRPKARVTHIN